MGTRILNDAQNSLNKRMQSKKSACYARTLPLMRGVMLYKQQMESPE
ncbi:hypothetical protein SAMN05216302_10508 [Nitrosomonas aestuarii]|uniref:Uncharacterized protein n=1 Tax=Nitrosomonas aestuarii TaxID=52441 RepID=A0A1I4GC22_9PROT|nr:hypothetical protein [Nitrosomonas aestuarii]SFL26666.1 hypothetical protein SAMN05216302_10508 [Nitrosomonas aestuarii]